MNKTILAKLFYSATENKTFSTAILIKELKNTLLLQNVTNPILIYTDRVGQFCSKQYHDFINGHPLLIGSITIGSRPDQNAVIERFNRTFKEQKSK